MTDSQRGYSRSSADKRSGRPPEVAWARAFFGSCYFDEDKCADGLQCLRNYRYEVDENTKQYSTRPLHDWASHGADAFRYAAVAMRIAPVFKRPKKAAGGTGKWMG